MLSIDVQHYARLHGDTGYFKGTLGTESLTPRLGDQVTIEAQLSRPAFAYLLAFRPDGVVDVRVPEIDLEEPPLTDELRYPPPTGGDEVRYGLSEGTGLWVFAVLASERRLPAYREFIAQHKPDWSPPPANATNFGEETVWWYNGERLDPLSRSSVPNNVRGKGDKAFRVEQDAVVHVGNWLKTASGGGAAAALGFDVRP